MTDECNISWPDGGMVAGDPPNDTPKPDTLSREQVEERCLSLALCHNAKFAEELEKWDAAQRAQIEALDGVADMADTCMKAERIRNAKLRADNDKLRAERDARQVLIRKMITATTRWTPDLKALERKFEKMNQDAVEARTTKEQP